MTDQIVFSRATITDTDGEVSVGQHTSAMYVINNSTNHWIEVKLNGGPHAIWIPPYNSHSPHYIHIPGDYTKIQVMTASSSIRAFAVG
jgi:hypothetical protein